MEPEAPSPDVLRLVRTLPAASVRLLLDELARVMEQRQCAEAQADGVPCPSVDADCPRCRRFHETLARLRAGVND